MDRTELPLHSRHIEVPFGASKMIFEPVVHLVQTVRLSYVKINTISKQAQTSFHLTHVT
jgi:hypothetical protein